MAVTRMRFHGTGSGTYYLDLNKALSLQLRKLHRQKVITTCYGGYYVDSNGSRVNLNVAPNTWPVKRAINRGFAQWRKMIARTLSNTEGGTTGKYSDFKIFLNAFQTGSATSTLNPVDANDVSLQLGTAEWNYSTLTTEDPALSADATSSNPPGSNFEIGEPDQFELHIVGPHSGANPDWNRVGLLQSWVNSRNTPQTEDPVDIQSTTDPLSNLFDTGDVDDDRLTIINEENDHPPYDDNFMFGLYTGGAAEGSGVQRVSSAVTTTANAIVPVHGFEAICGLVQIEVEGDHGQWELVLDVESTGVKF